ncbi:MAG: hypothetical protein JRJ85_14005 [Deltaproteobacteria bacterium]|nr:hypothetical protein [Deltaproteobacteria bacterium]
MEQDESISMARDIMTDFAGLTGLSPDDKVPPKRYLWTDAFAVCNFLGLYLRTGDEKYKDLAKLLVDQVHCVLGRHRDDDPRTGWISGLGEDEGRKHPAVGGLRIGKDMSERRPDEPLDEQLEWDRDGQYYHYLTKWMHALNRLTRSTGDTTYNTWAMELAKTAHDRFTYAPGSGGQKRMYWKMSIDLSYPLVTSMGHHDPLDGFITYRQLQATAEKVPEKSEGPDLKAEIAEMTDICEGKSWATDDPLGIGGLLGDAFRLAQLIVHENMEQTDLLETLLDASLLGLESHSGQDVLRLPADYRLAFRELGLSIGLKAVGKLQVMVEENPGRFLEKRSLDMQIDRLMQYLPLGEMIEKFWLEEANMEGDTWSAHRDINMVMLATCLAHDGYLLLSSIER